MCKFELFTIYEDMFEDVVCKQNELCKVRAKNVEYDLNILYYITNLLLHIMISTHTHVVRNLVKTNLRKHLNKL